MSEVTRIRSAIAEGDPDAAGQLLPLVYDELRKLATARVAHESPGHSYNPDTLIAPIPYPGLRRKGDWDSFLLDLNLRRGGHWANSATGKEGK
jgi:hypothetical protein